jgi:hypothetical protein
VLAFEPIFIRETCKFILAREVKAPMTIRRFKKRSLNLKRNHVAAVSTWKTSIPHHGILLVMAALNFAHNLEHL